MTRANVSVGESVLDIGCGCGQTSLELAQRVGPTGRVVGVDISEPMLKRARERADHAKQKNAEFVRTDAQVHPFSTEFDLLFSRFGVMFFDDPGAAFVNLANALKPGGRLTFLCWQGIEHNPWLRVPLMAVADHIELPPPPPPESPGPMAFANVDRLEALFADAGFEGIESEAFRTEVLLAGGSSLEAATQFLLEIGPVGRIASEAPPETRHRIRNAVRDAIAPSAGPNGVTLGAGMWIYRAYKSS